MSTTIKLIPPGQGFDRLTEAVTTEYRSLIDLVRQALREKLRGTPSYSDSVYVDVQGIWPDRVVCYLGSRLFSYTYKVQPDNTIQLGDGTEVVLAFTPVREAATPAAAGDTFREAADGSGGIECTLIRAGRSVNGNFYSDQLLRESASMFEGVRVFSKADAVHKAGGGKDVAGLLGGIYGVRFVEGAEPNTGSLVGVLRPLDDADPTVVKMREAVRRGMAGLMGLSIDAEARVKKVKRSGQAVREAVAFTKVHSVDLIVEPGAGGGLDRLTEATDPTPEQHDNGETVIKQRLYAAIKAKDAARAATIDLATVSDEDLVKLYESVMSEGAAPGTQRTTEAAGSAAGTGDDAPVTRAELQLHAARLYASSALASCTLPQAAKDKLRTDLMARERLTEAAVDEAIKREREYLARFTESGRPTGGMPRIEVGDRTATVADMLDAFFDPQHKNHREVRSIRECYVEITGDRHVTGTPDRARLTESIGTDTFANALGSAITRRLQTIYRDFVAYDSWRAVASVAPVNDFRTQERTQIGGYGDLPTVAERGAYAALTDPSDAKATYAVTKRGGLAQLTMEAFKNDDVGAIRRVPMELGRSAKRTLFKFVMNFFASNPTIYDSVALYHASHNNLFTTALDATQLAAHRLAMKKQVGLGTATRMEIGPSFLLVPDDLEETAVNLFNRNTNNDATFIQKLSLKIIPVPTWTDTNDWVTVADPMDIPVLEIGFLDGQEEPVLLTQDSPTEGSVFTNDLISYKMRHVYGGNVLVEGWKGTTKAVVP